MSAISDAVKRDHRELKDYHDHIVGAPDDDAATRWQNQFTWELARHSVAEELVLYPAYESHLRDRGSELAEKDRHEHQTIKNKLKVFQGLRAGSPEFLPALKELMDDLSQHVWEEETNDLPALDAAVDAAEAEKLAKSFERTKAFTPTRSHPGAPVNPPFESVMGLLIAPIDRLGDMFRKFPEQEVS